MLILPLHHPLTRRNFPLATAGLVLLNLFVFVFLQSGDGRAYAEAARYHAESGLAAIEVPLYPQHIEGRPEAAMLERLPPPQRERWLAQAAQADPAFRQRLAQGELFADDDARSAWQRLNETFESLRGRAVTDRYALRASDPAARGLLGSQFLHGSWAHLLGNLLFLCLLGLLVEGALGPWRFLLLYLTSGVAAGLSWVLWQGGQPAMLVGASGAIAGLMGALAVIWGLRKIRFFYWFFVVFDYVRAPALLLLPAWLGWELLQLLALPDSRVAYSAHAGGIVAGALLALGARRAGWVRENYLADEEERLNVDAILAEARKQLRQMHLAEAERLLAPLAEAEPQRLDVAITRYRVARYGHRGDPGLILRCAHAVLDARGVGAAAVREQWEVLKDLAKLELAVEAAHRVRFADRLLAIGEGQAALELLESVQETSLLDLDLPQHWLALALRLSERGNATLATRALRGLLQRFPRAPQAEKARFLLSESGG